MAMGSPWGGHGVCPSPPTSLAVLAELRAKAGAVPLQSFQAQHQLWMVSCGELIRASCIIDGAVLPSGSHSPRGGAQPSPVPKDS